ncbi:MAG TPA: hypothetical protein PKD83_06770 [Ignavibacteria bacterium]|nr:hypothetical protein [Ignavibacteria bacterium]
MKKTIAVFLLNVVIFITSITGFAAPKAELTHQNITDINTITVTGSFKLKLIYIPVLIDGKWWIYVFDGSKIIEVFPE